MKLISSIACSILFSLAPLSSAADSLTPYTVGSVPDNVVDLWKDVDFRKDSLDVKVIKEWKEDGVVCRYVIYTVGTFKGRESRVAAFYTFPEGLKKGPAFVWAHGGGQRADRERGAYFAKQGYATIDYNWGGRELVDGISENTDWGNVDPTQGPQFYKKAFRPVKSNLLPDEHTIDSVVSPRNGNWYLLAYAGRRAITFLEQQPEVDPEKIGFTGFSMGGNITSYVAIDPRLKAVVPMVGGTGYITSPFPGLPDSGRAAAYRGHEKLYAQTMESQSYYPHVKAPVLVLTASDDFHGITDHAFSCMKVLPHQDWRVSLKMHFNHNLGAEQWILMNLWFDKYLKRESIEIPKTPSSELELDEAAGTATFLVKPDQADRLKSVDIYYSYDPNPQARFWNLAQGAERVGGAWSAKLKVHTGLPLFVFANCTYGLDRERESLSGSTSTYTITSAEQVHLPAKWQIENLKRLATDRAFSPDFSKGWGETPSGGLNTYKFRDPEMTTPGKDDALVLTLSKADAKYGVRVRVGRNKFLAGVKEPSADYAASYVTKPGQTEIVIRPADFRDTKQPQQVMPDWTNTTTLSVDVTEQGKPFRLLGNPLLKSLEWMKTSPAEK